MAFEAVRLGARMMIALARSTTPAPPPVAREEQHSTRSTSPRRAEFEARRARCRAWWAANPQAPGFADENGDSTMFTSVGVEVDAVTEAIDMAKAGDVDAPIVRDLAAEARVKAAIGPLPRLAPPVPRCDHSYDSTTRTCRHCAARAPYGFDFHADAKES